MELEKAVWVVNQATLNEIKKMVAEKNPSELQWVILTQKSLSAKWILVLLSLWSRYPNECSMVLTSQLRGKICYREFSDLLQIYSQNYDDFLIQVFNKFCFPVDWSITLSLLILEEEKHCLAGSILRYILISSQQKSSFVHHVFCELNSSIMTAYKEKCMVNEEEFEKLLHKATKQKSTKVIIDEEDDDDGFWQDITLRVDHAYLVDSRARDSQYKEDLDYNRQGRFEIEDDRVVQVSGVVDSDQKLDKHSKMEEIRDKKSSAVVDLWRVDKAEEQDGIEEAIPTRQDLEEELTLRDQIRKLSKEDEAVTFQPQRVKKSVAKERHRLLVQPSDLGLTGRIKKALVDRDLGLVNRTKRVGEVLKRKQEQFWEKTKTAFKITGKIALSPFLFVGRLFRWSALAFFRLIHSVIYGQFTKKAEKEGLVTFEIFLSEEAGKPGPIEFLIGQSRLLMLAIQSVVGLRILLFLHFLDRVIEFLTSYIHTIYRTWKLLRTVKRKMRRRSLKQEIIEIQQDFEAARIQIARLLMISGFYLEECKLTNPELTKPTFPIALAIKLRAHLDQMLDDLDFLNRDEAVAVAKKSLSDFLKSFIPNPFDFFSIVKDCFVMFFFVKYSRRETSEIYYRWLRSYQQTIHLLTNGETIDTNVYLFTYEENLAKILAGNDSLQKRISCWQSLNEVGKMTQENRLGLRRLFPLLCKSQQAAYPYSWNRTDLLSEFCQMHSQKKVQPFVYLEWEMWAKCQIYKSWKKQHVISLEDKTLYLAEMKDLRKRYTLYRRFYQKNMLL